MTFGERALSQLFKLKEGEDCSKFENLKKNPHFDEIAKELTSGQESGRAHRLFPMPTSTEKTS